MREVLMTLLLVFNLLLVAVILTDYVVRQVLGVSGTGAGCRSALRSPEMKGVHPDQDGLVVFDIDEDLGSFILDNEDPGENRLSRGGARLDDED